MRKIYWSKDILSLKDWIAKTIMNIVHYKTLEDVRGMSGDRFLTR